MSDLIINKAKNYLLSNGGSSIYCLSALSIIWGIYQIMSPILLTDQILEKVLSIGSLYLYEIALITCFIFLLIREHQRTTSLIILLGIFYMSSGLILNSLAGDDAQLSLHLGAALSFFSILKLWLLTKHGKLNFPIIELSGIMILSTLNFMLPGYLALRLDNELTASPVWRWSLLGAFVCILFNFKPKLDPLKLAKFSLEKLFLIIISTVNLLNFLALDYIFTINYSIRDFFPLLFLAFFYLINACCIIMAGARIPLALAPGFILFISESHWRFKEEIMQLPELLIICLTGCAFLWRKFRYDSLAYCGIFYATAWFYLDLFKIHHYKNSVLFIFAAYVTVLAWSCYQKHMIALVLFSYTLSINLISKIFMENYLASVDWNGPSSFFFFFSLLMLILNRICKKDHFADIIIMTLFAATIFFLPAQLSLGSTLICFSLFTLYTRILKNPIAGLIILTPITRHLFIYIQTMSGWHYVAFSFILLSIGTWFNIRKGKDKATTVPDTIKTRV